MLNRWTLIVVFIISLPTCGAGVVLPEGFVLNGIEGLARNNEPNGWSFVTDSDLVYLKTTMPAGSSLPILPSGSLDQIRSLAKGKQQTRVKIWGILTLFQKKNFLFPLEIIALSEDNVKPSEPLPTTRIDPNAIDPSVSQVIPAEVMKFLRSQNKIDLARMSEVMDSVQSDFSLIGKTGYITKDPDKVFIPDGFGRKVERGRLALLSCLTLEETEKTLTGALAPYRYTISGIVTTSNGKQYLLMYRAVRTYSNRNFTP